LHLAHVCLVKPESWKKLSDMPSLTEWQRVVA
jgi:hypothetical protein